MSMSMTMKQNRIRAAAAPAARSEGARLCSKPGRQP
jgi:hypothetical protein